MAGKLIIKSAADLNKMLKESPAKKSSKASNPKKKKLKILTAEDFKKKLGLRKLSISEVKKDFKLKDTDLFNAKGREISEIREEMKSKGAIVAFNSINCKNNHTYRDRSNRCIICDRDSLGFQNNYSSDGYFYVAGSIKSQVLKVGITKNIENRTRSLKGYAGIGDWVILYSCFVSRKGELEYLVKKELKNFIFPLKYFKDGKYQSAQEVFRCEFFKIESVFQNIIQTRKIKIGYIMEKKEILDKYQFKK